MKAKKKNKQLSPPLQTTAKATINNINHLRYNKRKQLWISLNLFIANYNITACWLRGFLYKLNIWSISTFLAHTGSLRKWKGYNCLRNSFELLTRSLKNLAQCRIQKKGITFRKIFNGTQVKLLILINLCILRKSNFLTCLAVIAVSSGFTVFCLTLLQTAATLDTYNPAERVWREGRFFS